MSSFSFTGKKLKLFGIVVVLLLAVPLSYARLYAQQKQKHSRSNRSFQTNPAFMLANADGKTVNFTAQKGKVVFVNFWALTCGPCKAEMPSISKLYDHYKDSANVIILSVDADADFVNSAAYLKKLGFNLPLYKMAGSVPHAYFRGLLPTTVVIDKHGKTQLYREGDADYSSRDFTDFIDTLRKK